MPKMTRKAVLSYFGGKARMAAKILPYFPQHVCYCEPFGGAASLLLQKGPAYCEVYNDRYHEVVSFFEVLRTRPAELIALIELTPYAREEHARAWESTDDPLELARRLYVRSWQGRGRLGTLGKDGWRFSRTCKRSRSVVDDWRGVHHLWAIAERFRHVQIECGDAIAVIERFDAPTTLHYIDPPYVQSTRCKRWASEGYVHEMDDDAHRELARILHQVQGMVILSGYPCELYEELYGSWECVHFGALADGAAGGSVRRVEGLWLSPRTVEARGLWFVDQGVDSERVGTAGA